MSILACGDLGSRLEQLAATLRPREQNFVSVLKIVHRLGSKVCLSLEKESLRASARVDLSAIPPTIYLTRHSPVRGERGLDSHEDHLLTTRERFSVAHELGHIVAYKKFGVLPAKDKSSYWAQEELMHRFAGTLLTPDSIIDRCLSGLRESEPVSPFVLQESATKQARLSQEVLATQLCLRRADIGFMKVALVERKRDNKSVLRVLFARSGSQVFLPNNHSHLHNEYLLRRLATNESGSVDLASCTLGTEPLPQNLNVTWRRAGTLKRSDPRSLRHFVPIYWISLASYAHRDDYQLSLW